MFWQRSETMLSTLWAEQLRRCGMSWQLFGMLCPCHRHLSRTVILGRVAWQETFHIGHRHSSYVWRNVSQCDLSSKKPQEFALGLNWFAIAEAKPMRAKDRGNAREKEPWSTSRGSGQMDSDCTQRVSFFNCVFSLYFVIQHDQHGWSYIWMTSLFLRTLVLACGLESKYAL